MQNGTSDRKKREKKFHRSYSCTAANGCPFCLLSVQAHCIFACDDPQLREVVFSVSYMSCLSLLQLFLVLFCEIYSLRLVQLVCLHSVEAKNCINFLF